MLSQLIRGEIEYASKFADSKEQGGIIRFSDANLPNMYTHNFTLITEKVSEDKFHKIVSEELVYRRSQNSSFLQIEFNFPVSKNVISDLPVVPRVTTYDYMCIEPSRRYSLLGNKSCTIRKALSEEVLQDGIRVDILANQDGMGASFAEQRIQRKALVYKAPDSSLGLYVCYADDVPIGNCELMLSHSIAKLEDFDILPDFQRKGYGTSMVRYLLDEAANHHIKWVYLITESEDTAKEMYSKCGFEKVGEKYELFFNLQ